MTTPAISVKTAIQNVARATLLDFAGVGGSHVDPDLPTAQLLKVVDFGYELSPTDFKAGPILRLAVAEKQFESYTTTMASGRRAMLCSYSLQLIGTTRPALVSLAPGAVSSVMQADTEAALMEEIIQERLPVAFNGNAAQSQATAGGKRAAVTNLQWQGSNFKVFTDDGYSRVVYNISFYVRVAVTTAATP